MKIRTLANVSTKMMSKLLNVTAHTYVAYEQGRMRIPKEILKMISLIFRIDESTIIDPYLVLSKLDLIQLEKISQTTEEEKLQYLASGILDAGVAINYHNIKKVKDRIRNIY